MSKSIKQTVFFDIREYFHRYPSLLHFTNVLSLYLAHSFIPRFPVFLFADGSSLGLFYCNNAESI